MKYYVVLKGRTTGMFTNRDKCKRQVDGFLWAQYKSFSTQQGAQFARKEQSFWQKWQFTWDYLRHVMWQKFEKAICTDAACPSNPGPVEYRGVIVANWEEIFNYGPLDWWSVNIAEFLAIVKGLERSKNNKKYTILYSDSITAIWWVKKGCINTTIRCNNHNKKLFEIINNSIQRLHNNPTRSDHITILKRPTSQRGQIPADFGRK